MPAVGGNRVLPEKLLFGFSAFSLNEVAHNRDALRVRCMMVAIRPVAGVKNVIFTEEVPKGAECLLVECRTASLFDSSGDYLGKFNEDIFVLRQVMQQRPIPIVCGCFGGHACTGQVVDNDPQLGNT